MNPDFWGKSAWRFLHSITFNYGDEKGIPTKKEKTIYKAYFNLLPYILPCDTCKESFLCLVKENPIDKHLKTRETLIKWLYILHNKVNKKLVKPEESEIDFRTFYNSYQKEQNINNINRNKIYYLRN